MPDALVDDEAVKFLAEVRAHWVQHYAMIVVLFSTAMRISTAIALRIENLDPAKEIMHVRRRRSGHDIVPGANIATFNDAQRATGLVFPSVTGGSLYW